MPLPKLTVPTYDTNLISNNSSIEYRPFLVKEEKLLLTALESKDSKLIYKTIFTILENCILTKNINVKELPSFDVEYLFLRIREKSIGEAVTVSVTCPESKKRFELELDFSNIKIEKNNNINNLIQVNDNIGIVLKYPTFSTVQDLDDKKTTVEKIFHIITKCIDKIFDKETTYNPNEYTEEELRNFIDSLPQKTLTQINNFYTNFPKIVYEKEIKSPYTGSPVKVRLDSFMDFFG